MTTTKRNAAEELTFYFIYIYIFETKNPTLDRVLNFDNR